MIKAEWVEAAAVADFGRGRGGWIVARVDRGWAYGCRFINLSLRSSYKKRFGA